MITSPFEGYHISTVKVICKIKICKEWLTPSEIFQLSTSPFEAVFHIIEGLRGYAKQGVSSTSCVRVYSIVVLLTRQLLVCGLSVEDCVEHLVAILGPVRAVARLMEGEKNGI